ncbi:hypothetical protein KBC55_02250 [Patescibacteria group bacterium]|nr:hypothetical protein [Patescibacteria group bacterium]
MSWLSSVFGAKKEAPKATCHDGVCAMPVKKGGMAEGGNGGKVSCGESCDCCDEESDTDRCCDDCEDCGAGEADE